MSSRVRDALAALSRHAHETERDLKVSITGRSHDAVAYNEAVTAGVHKFRSTVERELESVKAQADELEASLSMWSNQTKARLQERETRTADFTSSLSTGLAGLQASLESASKNQLELLSNHKTAINAHLESERVAVTTEAAKVTEQIQSYVDRIIGDFAKATIRRSESSAAKRIDETDSLSRSVETMTSSQGHQSSVIASSGTEWLAASKVAFESGQAENSRSFDAAVAKLAAAKKSTEAAGEQSEAGAVAITGLAEDHLSKTSTACDKANEVATAVLVATEDKLSAATAQLGADEAAQEGETASQTQKFDTTCYSLSSRMTSTVDAVGTFEAKSSDESRQIKTDVQVFAVEELQQDLGVPPSGKKYSYPIEFTSTAPYGQVLHAQMAEWSREADLNSGKINPGKLTDYPGELGLDDESGIYAATASREVEDEHVRVAEAAADSDPEEYEIPE